VDDEVVGRRLGRRDADRKEKTDEGQDRCHEVPPEVLRISRIPFVGVLPGEVERVSVAGH
jgi:hypothetical protein